MVLATDRITGMGVEELAEAFRALEIPPRFKPHESRFLIALWRRLAEGVAIGDLEVEEIASDLSITADVAHEFLQWMSERDEEGNIRGVLGLTLNDMFPTKLIHNGEDKMRQVTHEEEVWKVDESIEGGCRVFKFYREGLIVGTRPRNEGDPRLDDTGTAELVGLIRGIRARQ